MKKYFFIFLAFASLSAIANTPELDFASKKDVEKVGHEFAVNFSHSAVAAPETEGIWGLEVGIVAGATSSPELSDVVDANNGDGSDFKKIYTAGLMSRVHFPLEFYGELTFLPETEVSEVKAKNRTFGLGWNAGAFFNLPLDIAIGANFSNGEASYSQTVTEIITDTGINSKINLKTKTRILYVGASKKFLFFTPYLKAGVAKTEADLKVNASTGSIFSYSDAREESVKTSGGYFAAGLNFQVLVMRFGVEFSKTASVNKTMGKFSLDF